MNRAALSNRSRRSAAPARRASGAETLQALFQELDQFTRPITPDELARRLDGLHVTPRELARDAQFDDRCYRRNLVHSGPTYDALFLCWRSGQRSPIHDHRGSACAVRVLSGIASETIFERSPSGLVYATGTTHHAPGSVTAAFDADMHQMGNLQPPGVDLVTLHVYSPPLKSMQLYFVGDAVIGEQADALATALRTKAARGRPPRLQAALTSIRQRVRTAAVQPEPGKVS